MSATGYKFTIKVIGDQHYIYLQWAKHDQKLGMSKTRSFSLGNIKNINNIITEIMSKSEPLFIGEYILYKLAQELTLDIQLKKGLQISGVPANMVHYFYFLINMRIVRLFSKNGLARYYTHSYFKILEKQPHVNKFYESMDLILPMRNQRVNHE